MRRLLNARTVKEVVKLQSTVLCAFIAGIRARNVMDRGRSKKCKHYNNIYLKSTSKDKEPFPAALLKCLNLC